MISVRQCLSPSRLSHISFLQVLDQVELDASTSPRSPAPPGAPTFLAGTDRGKNPEHSSGEPSPWLFNLARPFSDCCCVKRKRDQKLETAAARVRRSDVLEDEGFSSWVPRDRPVKPPIPATETVALCSNPQGRVEIALQGPTFCLWESLGELGSCRNKISVPVWTEEKPFAESKTRPRSGRLSRARPQRDRRAEPGGPPGGMPGIRNVSALPGIRTPRR